MILGLVDDPGIGYIRGAGPRSSDTNTGSWTKMKEYQRPIKCWPEEERPRERLLRKGADVLTDAELLAILLRTGDASSGLSALDIALHLLAKFGSLRGIDRASPAELEQVPGMGPAKAAAVKAALALGRRFASEGEGEKVVFRSSSDVAKYYLPKVKGLKKEVFRCALLDMKNRLIKDVIVSEGSLGESLVHPREAFLPAVRESAAAVIFVHNHPSGDPSPSREDVAVTEQLVRAGRILGIKVLDHVILGEGRVVSLAEEGLLGG